MVINMVKGAGGTFVPADEMYLPSLQHFQNGEVYEVEIKRHRNPSFHRKVFAFLKFCFDHWTAQNTEWEFQDELKQFDTFRKNLTVLAGFKEVTYTIDGRLRVEPQSLSFGNMDQDEFESCYNALINAAMKHVFNGTNDPEILDKLVSFF